MPNGKEEYEVSPMQEEGREDSSEVELNIEDDTIEIDDEELEGGEVQAHSRSVATPVRPSKDEVDEHNRHHFPYCGWCPHCVKGKGVASSHKMVEEIFDAKNVRIPLIDMDYMFMGDDEHEKVTILVARDRRSGATMAMWVPVKGIGQPWISKRVAVWIDAEGYGRLIIKSDQEESICALQR